MAAKQETRMLKIATPLGADVVHLISLRGREELSRLFSFDLEIAIEKNKGEIKPDKLIGQNLTFAIEYRQGQPRFFNGFVRQMVAGEAGDKRQQYRLEVVPWLWFLTQTSDCRIFQEKTVPEIVTSIFSELGFKDFDIGGIKGKHHKWIYCVQYRETDFNFVSRLLEQEGIYYYFKHIDGKHTLMLADSADGYIDCVENAVPYPPSIGSQDKKHHLTSWEHRYEYVSGKWTQTEYNFETPSTNLLTTTNSLVKMGGNDKYEIYDYPGEYEIKGDGQDWVKARMEEEEAPHSIVMATSHCRTFMAGGRFAVTDHPIASEKGKQYVITSVTHNATEPMAYETGVAPVSVEYANSFTCIPSNVAFRPGRTTPKPIVSGVQTAVVVGPKGEEIYCDKYGRVKVQFHWDRYGKRDEKSSCWIRSSHNVAGKKWGFMAIPRIGQEVVVEFEEGDPDRPLIVGSVYNAEQMPHYELPSHKTKTYIKTNSSMGGEGFNELFFEDKKSDERIFIHAQKNMDTRVLNDSKARIFGNRHQIIGWQKDGKKGGDQREMVWQDKHLKIKRHQVEHIEGSYQLMVGNGESQNPGQLDVVVEKHAGIKVGKDGVDFIVDGDVKQKIGGTQSVTVKGGRKEKLASVSTTVDGAVKEKVGSHSLNVGQDQHVKVGMNSALQAGQAIHIKGGMNVVVEAGLQLTLKVGGNFVSIGPAGVDISGVLVKINSGGAAGSGSGASPQAPDAPAEPKEAVKAAPVEPALAHDEKTGFKSCP